MNHKGKHTRKIYKQKHLTVIEKTRMDNVVEFDPLIIPKAATVVGVSFSITQ